MAWKKPFHRGVQSFRAGHFDDALSFFNQAIEFDADQFLVYDSRAAVYDRLGNPKDALRDAKKVIALAPAQWHGYARSARVLLKADKHDAALAMIRFALDRVESGNTKRRAELMSLQESALLLRKAHADEASTHGYHLSWLPVEIFGEIFREVTSQDFTRVLVLASICVQWRIIALNTAALWRTLVLSEKRPAAKAKIWTERSKGRIRELHVREGVMSDPDWTFSCLDGLSWDALRVCRLEEHSFFPHLRIDLLSDLVDLQISRPSGKNSWNPFLAKLATSKLHSLTINNATFHWAVLAHRFTELTSLVVCQPNSDRGDDLFSVIESNPKLQKLVLDVRTITLAPDRETPIHLPHLTHLEISGRISLPRFFENITQPSLVKLCLSRNFCIDVAFTQLTPTALTELRVEACGVSSSTLIQFLQSALSLQTLALTHLSGVANAVVEALAGSGGSTDTTSAHSTVELSRTSLPPCPSLMHVDFSYCDDIKTGPLIHLIKSRQAYARSQTDRSLTTLPVVPISSLMVNGCPYIEASTLPWLRSQLQAFSCVYMSKKEAKRKR